LAHFPRLRSLCPFVPLWLRLSPLRNEERKQVPHDRLSGQPERTEGNVTKPRMKSRPPRPKRAAGCGCGERIVGESEIENWFPDPVFDPVFGRDHSRMRLIDQYRFFKFSSISGDTLKTVPCLVPSGKMICSEISSQFFKSFERTAPIWWSMYLSK